MQYPNQKSKKAFKLNVDLSLFLSVFLGEIECVQPTLFCFIYGGGYLSAVMPIP
jgi:hypothetical protein